MRNCNQRYITSFLFLNSSQMNNFENVLKELHLVKQIQNNSGHYVKWYNVLQTHKSNIGITLYLSPLPVASSVRSSMEESMESSSSTDGGLSGSFLPSVMYNKRLQVYRANMLYKTKLLISNILKTIHEASSLFLQKSYNKSLQQCLQTQKEIPAVFEYFRKFSCHFILLAILLVECTNDPSLKKCSDTGQCCTQKKLVRFRPIKLQDTRKTDQSKLWTANHHFSPIHYLSLLISSLNIYNLGLYERSISYFLLEFQYCQ